ncbi:hypothetical protein A3K80_00920 [Candidatus Bathyarchaeota archaeon RBG_13_38_9]|nr:MAG: hypothetical protein A3K80_00920 [Candidatus Bathyarchaeota archaeon RBG_13_38_9]
MRYFFGISILFLILMITQTIAHVASQTSQEDPFSEGSNWTYQLTKNSNTEGTGKYKGTSTTIEISKGSVNVTKSNSTVLIIEDSRITYYNSSGTGFFKHKKSENISNTIITTIERQTLTVRSCRINNGTSDQFVEDKSMIGKPTIHFISTNLKEALNVKLFWGNENIVCSINQKAINPHDNNSSLITLNYSGPKVVIMQTVTSFPKEGKIDSTFNYDENTGLLLSYNTNETAKHSEGSCCWVKTDKIENYDVRSISLWTQQEVSNPEMNEALEYAFDNLQIIMAAIGISAIIIVGYIVLYRRRTVHKTPK